MAAPSDPALATSKAPSTSSTATQPKTESGTSVYLDLPPELRLEIDNHLLTPKPLPSDSARPTARKRRRDQFSTPMSSLAHLPAKPEQLPAKPESPHLSLAGKPQSSTSLPTAMSSASLDFASMYAAQTTAPPSPTTLKNRAVTAADEMFWRVLEWLLEPVKLERDMELAEQERESERQQRSWARMNILMAKRASRDAAEAGVAAAGGWDVGGGGRRSFELFGYRARRTDVRWWRGEAKGAWCHSELDPEPEEKQPCVQRMTS
ncbi:hypothetical protein LTR85_006683 [Meristemomyces frigidus]|nr:hypothetical protein LTR85_006683 [Meristemomyces frigidus]